MIRTAHTLGGLFFAVAVVLVTPAFGQAQHGGGGHGGGGHGGGGHFGGGHIGGAHFGGAGLGGYRGGTYRGGYHAGYNGYPHTYTGHRYGYGYRYPYGSYGSYLSYFGDYGSSGYGYDNDYSSYAYDDALGTTDSPSYRDVTRYYLGGYQLPPTYQAGYSDSPSTDSSSAAARVTVKVPSNATVWFDGVQMSTTGSVRQYQTPPLAPGQYSYEVRARWSENGREVNQTQQVAVTARATVEVGFPMASGVLVGTQPTTR